MAQPPNPERRYVQKAVDALIQWVPLGGSGGAFVHFLLQQDWVLAMLTFPAMAVSAVWAGYIRGFTTTLEEIADERGKRDANALANFFDGLDRTLRWRLSGFDGKYLKAQATACRRQVGANEVQIPAGIQNPDLEDVYVSLRLSGEFLRNLDGQAVPTLPGFGDKPEEVLEQIQARQTYPIWWFLAQGQTTPQFRRLVILAYGGFGKTTLLRHLTYLYTTRPRLVRRRHQAPTLTPFLLYLRTWRDTIAQAEPPTLPDLITQHHAKSLPQCRSTAVPARWAESLLQKGRALVMIDGFDEVAEAQRPAVSQWITTQMQEYPQATFILTSRPTAYNQDYTAEKVQTPLAVQPFDEDQRQGFIERWYLSQERLQRGNQLTADVKQVAEERSADLLGQIAARKELESMAENPLMLNMIAMFHRSYPNERLPRRQDQLYREICKLQLGDRPLAKRVDLPLPADISQLVLQGVALAMMQQEKTTLPQPELVVLVQQEIATQAEPVDPRSFVEMVEQVSELLVRKDDGYEFSHRSFQEYLAATEIKRRKDEDLLLQHFDQEYWKGTILLYVPQVNPSSLLTAAHTRSHGAASLAYDCTKVSRRPLEGELIAAINLRRYDRLEAHLKAGEWQAADEETWRLMLQTYGKELGNYLVPSELLNFPCEDLLRLDDLWLRHSEGKFGFTVQKEIYLTCGGIPDGNYDREAFAKFGDTGGWRKENQWDLSGVTYDTSAPNGNLPWEGRGFVWVFFSRIQTCEL